MLRKSEILEGAHAAGLGSVEDLGAKFDSWQRFGLVGKMAQKAPRQGGEGLWHPIQAELFAAALRNRDRGTRLSTVANLPVGLWLIGFEGIEVEQAQPALFYWATRRPLPRKPHPPSNDQLQTDQRGNRPSGPRSIRDAALKAIVDQYAAGDASTAARRAFLEQLRIQSDGIARASGDVTPDFLVAFLGVAHPGSASTPESRSAGENIYYWIRLQLIGSQRFGLLCSNRSDVDEFWTWVRRYSWEDLDPTTPPAPAPPWTRVGVWTPEAVAALEAALQRSCANVLGCLGVGLRILAGGAWPTGWLRPPTIQGLDTDPNWGAHDRLLELAEEDRRMRERLEAERPAAPPDLG